VKSTEFWGALVVGIISAIAAAIVGCACAGFAAWGVASSTTAAPSHNPASVNVVNYGSTK
jgi:hypothetical protein